MTQARSPQDVRARNLDAVLTAVSRHGLRTRNAIAAATGLHKSSVSSLVGELTQLGVLRQYAPEHHTSAGRPAAFIEVVPSVAVGLGLELRADALIAHVADMAGHARYQAALHLPHRLRRPESVLADLDAVARAACAELERQQLRLSGVTIAVAEVWSGLALPDTIGDVPVAVE